MRIASTAAAFRLSRSRSARPAIGIVGLAAILVLSSAAAAQVAARDPRYTEVYSSGEKGYNTFRIPSVIATSRGTLLAFAEARREGAGDAGDIDLVLKRS